MESTLAGCANVLFSDTNEAAHIAESWRLIAARLRAEERPADR
jgi:acetyl-CoA carboxylase alpha subunit